MATKRHSKTWEQQAKYYEVDNIAEYMVETYLNGNFTTFRELYRAVSYTHLTLPTTERV